MLRSEQLKLINSIEERLRTALDDVEALKANILTTIPDVDANATNGKTLQDVYQAIYKKNESYASRFSVFCKKRGIDTLELLLSIPSCEFTNAYGIGVHTSKFIMGIMENLGIIWTDGNNKEE